MSSFLRRAAQALLSGAVALLTPMVRAQPAAAPAVVHYQLQNGLDVVLQQDDRQPRVAVLVGYDVGSRDDPPGLDGLAHMVEHLTFRSTRHLPDTFEAWKRLQRAGATNLNGTTGEDVTMYQAVVPSDALALALYVESERMAFSLERFSTPAIQLEKGIIWREDSLLHTSPEDQFQQDVLNVFFGKGNPYAKDEDTTEQLGRADLKSTQAFFQQTYRPDNAHLILVGDFELEETRALIDQYFGPIVSPALARRQRPVPSAFTPARAFVRHSSAKLDALCLTWLAPDLASDDGAASELLAAQLRRPLQDALIRERGLAVKVEVKFRALDLGGLFQIVISAEKDIKKVLPTLQTQLAALWQTDWSRRLPLLRKRVVFSDRLESASLLATANAHLWWLNHRHQPFDAAARVAQLNRVTPERMRGLVRWFRGDRAMLGWLLRFGDSPASRTLSGIEVVPR